MIHNVEAEDHQRLALRTAVYRTLMTGGGGEEPEAPIPAEGCRQLVTAFDLIASQFLVARFATMQMSPGQTLGQAQTATCGPREAKINTLFSRFVKDESGATAAAHGLIAAGIFIAIIAVIHGMLRSGVRG